MNNVDVRIPDKLVDVFDFTKYYRVRGAYGGRGSGKTRTFAILAAIRGWQLAMSGRRGVILCGREFMNSLEDSSMAEVKEAINSIGWLRRYYDIGEKYIRTKDRNIEFTFAGLRHNLDSIKSKSRILIAWIDEAESVSEMAWQKLLPTVRAEDSEVWVTWNPEKDGSATDTRFIKKPPANSKIVKIGYKDNPFFPKALEIQRRDDKARMVDGDYAWVWEGEYRKNSKAQIFANKYRVAEFEPEARWTLVQGLDWGFAVDPTAAVRCYVWNDTLFISHEAVKVQLELDDTVSYIAERIPDFADYVTRADNARPESIRHVNRHGFDRVVACAKGKGSVKDGIEHMKSYREIVIHPRCTETIKEFRLYSYKVDAISKEILSEPADAYNHCIDAIRYALEPIIKHQTGITISKEGEEILGAF